MSDKPRPSATDCANLLRYDPQTGRLFWKPRPVEAFGSAGRGGAHGAHARWAGKHEGKEAFTAINPGGYHYGQINGYPLLAHRVIWAIVYGYWPSEQVDHINGDRENNLIANLRLASNAENARNRSKRADNSSGETGIYWNKRFGKWQASARIDGKNVSFGYYSDKADAVAARQAGAAQSGVFSKRHGADHG